MDEMLLLRSMREDTAPPTAAAAERGRHALEERISGARRPRRLRRPVLWGATGVATAASIVAALVLTDVVGLAGFHGGAEPAAAAVLDRAALGAIRSTDPIVGPGQYLEVATHAVYSSDTPDGFLLVTQDGREYIPADRADDWVWVRDPSTLVRPLGATTGPPAPATQQPAAAPEIIRAPEGRFYNSPPEDHGLAALPRDPTRLLNRIYRVTAGGGNSADGEALVFIADTLRTGVVPADLRSALYRAAAMIPGVEVTASSANLDGRVGVALGRAEKTGVRQDIILDPATGELIGERRVTTAADVIPGVPAGTVIDSTAVTTTVVDAAPSGGTLCGDGWEPVGGPGSGRCRMTDR